MQTFHLFDLTFHKNVLFTFFKAFAFYLYFMTQEDYLFHSYSKLSSGGAILKFPRFKFLDLNYKNKLPG